MKTLFASAFLALAATTASAQTIPNASFDNWAVNTLGANDPVDWLTSNFMSGTTTISAEAMSASHSGAAAISLKNPTAGFSAFALTLLASHERPETLKGFFRYLPNGTDSASVMVSVTKWDAAAGQSNAIGGAELLLGGTTGTDWNGFEMPIQYATAGQPDSIVIMILASGRSNPQEGSVFMVDDLEFVSEINGIADNQKALNLNVYPNPTTGAAFVQLTEEMSQAHKFELTDMLGRVVQTGHISADMLADNRLKLDASNLNSGFYQVLVTSPTKVATARLVVSR